MKTLTKRIFALVGILALGITAMHAQEDALLDALVKKGVLSDQEAEDIRANIAKDYAQTPAGKLSLSNHITNLTLYGDARLRFEYLDETPQNKALNNSDPNITTTDRSRYRIRLGANYTFTDNFNAGFELESATAGDSANQTMGNGFGKFAVNIGLVYLQWKPTDWLTLTGGKQRNPIYTTDLVWDPDINPEGGSEVLSFHPTDDFSIGVTAAQFIYADNNEQGNSSLVKDTPNTGNVNASDIWMFVEQIPMQFNFDKDTFIKEVPGFTAYLAGGNTNLSSNVGGWTGSSVTYVDYHAGDHLAIFTAPGEFDWKAWDIPFKLYWDFAYNTQGKERIQNTYLFGAPTDNAFTTAFRRENQNLGDNVAWLAGVQVGQNKKKGDWSVKGDFRQVGLGAVDPNINDSDFADSFLNQQGIKVQSVYNFTDFLTGSITYFNTWNYKANLFANSGTGAIPSTGGTALNGESATAYTLAAANTTQRVQVDLMWKF
jgi:hypothetical protein